MRIQIIGGSGTGKSTLGEYFAHREQIKWIDTDSYLWKDDTFLENNPIEIRREMYQRDISSNKCYVVSGSIFSWHPDGFSDRELLVFLSLPENERMDRIRKREISRKTGKQSWLDEHGLYTNDFIEWCKTYLTETDKSQGGTYVAQRYEMELSQSPILQLDSSKEVEALYDEIKQYLWIHNLDRLS